MAAIEGADPKTNTELSGIGGFAVHFFQPQAIKPFPEVNRAQRICSPAHLSAGTSWGDPARAASLAAGAQVGMLIWGTCAPEEESRTLTSRMRNRTVFPRPRTP